MVQYVLGGCMYDLIDSPLYYDGRSRAARLGGLCRELDTAFRFLDLGGRPHITMNTLTPVVTRAGPSPPVLVLKAADGRNMLRAIEDVNRN